LSILDFKPNKDKHLVFIIVVVISTSIRAGIARAVVIIASLSPLRLTLLDQTIILQQVASLLEKLAGSTVILVVSRGVG
jgi:hypothetical protein